jgi:hypothetical protein
MPTPKSGYGTFKRSPHASEEELWTVRDKPIHRDIFGARHVPNNPANRVDALNRTTANLLITDLGEEDSVTASCTGCCRSRKN